MLRSTIVFSPDGIAAGGSSNSVFLPSCLLALASAVGFWRGHPIRGAILLAVAGALAIVLILNSHFAEVFDRGGKRVAQRIAAFQTALLLTLVYGLVFVPYGWLSRLAGRDPLDLRPKRGSLMGRESYWIPREHTRQSRDQFERLF